MILPSARVLTFGYDTRIRHWVQGPVNSSTVYDIARDLLVALEAERRQEAYRPVTFVVHSLGGIVVKEMLRQSQDFQISPPHLHTVFQSTNGIMFFGTPHAGADPLGFLRGIVENVCKTVGFRVNQHIIDTLMPTSERLAELRREFGAMAVEREWKVHSFQERYGVQALNQHKVGIKFIGHLIN